MKINLFVNKKLQIYFLFVAIGLFAILLHSKNKELQGKYQLQIYLELKNLQKLYIEKIYPFSVASFTLEDPEYIDNRELEEDFKNITPLYPKENQNTASSSIQFILFDIRKDKNNLQFQQKLTKLSFEKNYFIEENNSNFEHFSKIDENKYLLISKYYKHNNELNNYFLYVVSIVLVNIALFIYLIYLLQENQNYKKSLEDNFQNLEYETKKIAMEDTLTKASSRLKFNQTLEDLLHIASRFDNQKFSLIMLDIDNFKNINDSYGHDYGDVVLINIANIVKQSIRGSDTFARWGGEEFVILMPLIQLKEAVSLAQRIRANIETIPFEKIEKVTCSFGVTQYENGDNETTLLKKVDTLLYQAKKNGKNRVEF